MKRKSSSSSRLGDEDPSYEIGYAKPPKRTRFQPGHSGNPRGRPRGQRNFRTVIKSTLDERVTIREGERTRKVPIMEAIVRRCLNNALKGDPKAFAAFLQLTRSTGLLDEEPEPASSQSLSAEDQAILALFFERFKRMPHALDGGAGGLNGSIGPGPAVEPEDKV